MFRKLLFSLSLLSCVLAQAQLGDLIRPRGFVANAGQVKKADGKVADELLYRWQGPDFSIAFLVDRFVYEISYVHKDTLAGYRSSKPEERQGLRVGLHRIEYKFPAGSAARLLAEGGRKSNISYPDHQGGPQIVPMEYDNLVYKSAFPGVDLVFTTTADGQCKYDVVVAKGAKVADVRFDVTGLDAATTKMDGNQLTSDLPFGRFVERVPEAYAEKRGNRQKFDVGYAGSHRSVGYSVPEGVEDDAVVIDPIGLIEWGTWYCPPYNSLAWAVVAAEDNIVYVAGDCFSGALEYQTNTFFNGGGWPPKSDIWVAKFLDVSGTLQASDRVWCCIQGGPEDDSAQDLDVCGGMLAVVGYTKSSSGISTGTDVLNTDPPPVQACGLGIESDGYLMYIDAATGTKTFGTYIGGACNEVAHTVEFDCRPMLSPRCYVGGSTLSEQIYNPGILSPDPTYQLTPLCAGGGEHGFLQRFNPDGTMQWNTHYSSCGTYEVLVKDLDVDQDGNVVMVSVVDDGLNSATDLGVTFGTAWGGGSDLVLSSFSADGLLNWARFCGTNFYDGETFLGWDYSNNASVVINPNNDIYLGWYCSTDLVTDMQGYMTRIANNGNNPVEVWGAPLQMPSSGQGCNSSLKCMSVTCTGTIMVVGDTDCPNGEFSGTHQPLFGGMLDGFLLEVEDTGTSGVILDKTYYGGGGLDWVSGVSAHDPGKVYICGESASTIGGSGIDYNGIGGWAQGSAPPEPDAFLARFSFDCCPSTITIPDGTVSSVMGITTFTNEEIKVEGQWFIDSPISFLDCIVRTATGAEMIVTSPGYLHLDNTHISSCEEMWKGIHATDGALLRFKNSTIADAQFGVWLDDGTQLSAYQCGFVNNYTGIYIKKPCNGCWNSVGMDIPGCWFRTLTPGLKDPYPGQLPVPGSLGYAGIDASGTYLNISSTPVAGDILFKHLNYGITTGNVGFTVADTRFEDMIPDLTYGNNQHQGAAIYSTGYSGFYGLKLQGLGTALNATATFKNCRTSVWTESMGLRAQQCRVEGPMSLTGITARFSSGRLIDISSNNINVQHSAIDLRFNDGAAQLSVHDNELHFGLNGSNGLVMFPGINVQEMNGTNSASEIRNNQLHCRGAWRGMSLNSASNYLVSENTVAMLSQQVNRGGIELRGCTDTRVTCNTVFGQNVVGQPPWSALWPVSHFTQTGIRHSLGATNYLACNSVDNILHGILFNGWTPGLDLTANNFGIHNIGLELTLGALIGGQEAKGNIWNVQATTEDARWVGAQPNDVLNNQMEVNTSNPLCMPLSFEPVLPSPWFITTQVSNLECANIMPQCPSVNFQGGGGSRSQAMDEAVMQGVIQNGIYTDETRLTLAYELYVAMEKDPSLYAGGAYTATFLAAMDNAVAADLKDVEEPRKELYDMPTPVEQAVEQNLASIEALLALVKSALAQLAAGGLSPAQEAALQADIAGWQQNIESLNLYNTTAMANLDAARQAQALLLESGAAAIASSELIEQNAKQVNEIYLNTIAVTGEDLVFDAGQAATLYGIANQCPLVGGNPVYQARSLYSLVDETVDFDDALLCVAAGFAMKNDEQESARVMVFPNPNRDGSLNFRILGLGDGDLSATVRLWDALGREAGRASLNGDRTVMDVSQLAQGAYHWTITTVSGVLGQGTVTVY